MKKIKTRFAITKIEHKIKKFPDLAGSKAGEELKTDLNRLAFQPERQRERECSSNDYDGFFLASLSFFVLLFLQHFFSGLCAKRGREGECAWIPFLSFCVSFYVSFACSSSALPLASGIQGVVRGNSPGSATRSQRTLFCSNLRGRF